MPKPKPKKKKTETEKSTTITSMPVSTTTEMEETKETVPKTENDDQEVIDEKALHVMNLSVGLRAGVEYWKMIMMGKPLLPTMLRAYLAYKMGKPVKTYVIFKKIEEMKVDVVKDIERFESILCSDLQSWLAIKKK